MGDAERVNPHLASMVQRALDTAREEVAGHGGANRVELWGESHHLERGEVVRPYGTVGLYGPSVRHAALALLILYDGFPATIGMLLDRLAARRCYLCADRPDKALSDALGHEVAKGRVVRVSRGYFRIGNLSRTSRWRYLHRWGLRCWPEAIAAGSPTVSGRGPERWPARKGR